MSRRRENLIWRKSTRCGSTTCVESAVDPDLIYLRDGKDPGGPVLEFSHAAWQGLLDDIKAGGSPAR